jgi:hypothetical protein
LGELGCGFGILDYAGGAAFGHIPHLDLIIEDLADYKMRRKADAVAIVRCGSETECSRGTKDRNQRGDEASALEY